MNTLLNRLPITNRNQHFLIARKFFDTQTSFATFWHKVLRLFFSEKKFPTLAALTYVTNITSSTIPYAA